MAERKGKGLALGFPESKGLLLSPRINHDDIPAVWNWTVPATEVILGFLTSLMSLINIHIVKSNLSVSISYHLQRLPHAFRMSGGGGSRGGMVKGHHLSMR